MTCCGKVRPGNVREGAGFARPYGAHSQAVFPMRVVSTNCSVASSKTRPARPRARWI